MDIHALRGILVLLLPCLLQVANGNVESLGAQRLLLDTLLNLTSVVGGPPIGTIPLASTDPPLEDSCRQREQRAVSLTQTARALSFAPFFVGVGFPSSARVGETFPVTIAAFSIMSSPLPIRVSLGESPAYEIVGQNARSVCLPPNVQVDTSISVRPIQAGPATITAYAAVETSPGCGPSVTAVPYDIRSPIKLEHPGIPKEITFSKFMCSGDDFEEEDSSAEWRLEITEGSVIDGSVKAWVTVTGDLLGPTFHNLGDLIKMPYGCGEQNMITMTPNIYVLQYLKATNQLTSNLETQLLSNINAGYLRELQYKRRDGSYSAFGDRDDSGSTWLTAFVVKSFAQAQNYITIPQAEITESSAWLKNLQLPNGCFESVGRVIHKAMQGGINGGGAPGSLTAFVMVALLEAGESPSSDAITRGKACVDAESAFGTPGGSNYYLLALKAYAYSLAEFPSARAAIGFLFSGMMSGPSSSGSYWPIIGYGDALAIETTSYSLLAILTEYGVALHYQNVQIVKWLSTKMNSYGGFISTQDTVLALQALALFESLHPQPTLGVTVTVVGIGVDSVFQITEANNLEMQRVDVDVIPNDIRAQVEGNGCALVQAVVSYSVENSRGGTGLTLSVKPKSRRAQICGDVSFSTCVSYNLKDGQSNMAIIEITLVTGYVPEQSDLESLVCGGRGNIKMYEVHGSKVIFYVDQLTASRTCVYFRVSQETVVQNAKNGTVKVYDYYEPELFVSETFSLQQFNCPVVNAG